jgi:sugar (pentulose or hexulose) kinase
LWNQIKADVTGLQVNVPEITETTALGAAFPALVGIGAYSSLTEASDDIVKIRERTEPDPVTASLYTEVMSALDKLILPCCLCLKKQLSTQPNRQ